MAFTEKEYNNDRWTEFHYYVDGKADGWEQQTLSFESGVRFRLQEIRLKMSSIFLSVEDFIVYVSSVNGSYHNLTLLSQALSDIESLQVRYASGEPGFYSGDTIIFSASMDSNSNGWGLEVIGWAVRG